MAKSCPICFDEFDDKEVASTDVCDHLFCFSCLEKWAKLGSYCPVDRKRFKKIIKLNCDDVVQVKPRRRKKKNRAQYDVTAYCEICKLTTSSATLLLCDCCDLAYHCECLTPPLVAVPAGLWYCPPCVAIDERLKRRNGTSKECESQKENDSSSSSAENVSQSEKCSMTKLSPWKKKNFEASVNPCVSSEEEWQSLPEEQNSVNKKSLNGTLRVVVEKLDVANLVLSNDSILNLSQFERPVGTKSILGQKSSTSISDDVLAFKPKQELPTEFSSEGNVITENGFSQMDDNDKFPVDQKYETKIVAVVPKKKNFQFSIFQKLEDISSSELQYSELATVSNNPKSNIPCDICKCWKIKNQTDRLEKLLQKKKLHLNKHSANRGISLMKTPSKVNPGQYRINHHVRNALIGEIQKIQQKKWKLKENYNLKKRRIIRQLKKQIETIASNKNEIQTNDFLSTAPSCNGNIPNIKEEPNSSCTTTYRDTKHSKINSKSLNSNVMLDEISSAIEMSSDTSKACGNTTYNVTAAPKLSDQPHSSKDSFNFCDKPIKSEKDSNILQKNFHMRDLKRIVIRSDGSLYLDCPENI